MGGGFEVELDQLKNLINKLDHASDDITAANNELRDAADHDLGSDGIDAAARTFQQRWSDGIGKLSKAAQATSGALEGAQSTYQKVEHAVTEALTQHGGASGGDAGGGSGGGSGGPSRIEQKLNG